MRSRSPLDCACEEVGLTNESKDRRVEDIRGLLGGLRQGQVYNSKGTSWRCWQEGHGMAPYLHRQATKEVVTWVVGRHESRRLSAGEVSGTS